MVRGLILTPETVAQIAARKKKGESYKRIAEVLGISEGTVRNGLRAARAGGGRAPATKAPPAAAPAPGKGQPAGRLATPPPAAEDATEDAEEREAEARRKAIEEALAGVPEAIPEGTESGLASRWLTKLEKAAVIAEVDRNHTALASISGRIIGILEYIRKAKPPRQDDPNEHPDMIALGDEVWDRVKRALEFEE